MVLPQEEAAVHLQVAEPQTVSLPQTREESHRLASIRTYHRSMTRQYAFHHHFVLAERTVGDQTYKNLSFPMTIPGSTDGKIVGLEERGRRKQDGTSYKGMARGSNASEGLWIASPMGTKLQDAKRVFIFESAYDAMAFYQMLAGKDSNLTTQEKKELVGGVYASTGGNPSAKQFEGLLSHPS